MRLERLIPPGISKPYWLTEWGFSSKAASSDEDKDRAPSVAEVRAYLTRLDRQARLGGIFWYVWNEPDHDSIYSSGTVMEAGRLALAPIPAH